MKIRVALALVIAIGGMRSLDGHAYAADLNSPLTNISNANDEVTVLPVSGPQNAGPQNAGQIPAADDLVAAPVPLPKTAASAGTAAAEPASTATEQAADQASVGEGPGPGEPQPWRIPQPCFLQALGIETYGWIDQGVVFNSLSPSDRWNGPVVTADRSNDYELNQVWFGFERKVDTKGCGFDVGGRIDIMYGSDWRYGDSYGLETHLDYQHQLYGLILPQMYLEVAYNDLTVRLGHWAPSIGYEVVAAPGNFFYTHSYALAYSEPVLVTGMQADYKLSDQWNVIGGFNQGYMVFDDGNAQLNFLGGVKWHNDDTKTSVSFMLDAGNQELQGITQLFDYSLVFKQQLTENLLYAFEHVYGGEFPSVGGYARWYGLDQYLLYTINKCWSVGTRVEWFRDEEGARVAGVGNVNYGWMGAPGFAGTFTEATFGLNWRPNGNFVLRPELRWDWYDGSTNAQNQLPFGDGTRSQQFLFATDLIFSF
jgi:hypothetical protein